MRVLLVEQASRRRKKREDNLEVMKMN